MCVDVSFHEVYDARGKLAAVATEVRMLLSPSEGLDANKLETLEEDAGRFFDERLNAAIKRGGQS